MRADPPRVLVAHCSKHDATAEIAAAIANRLSLEGVDARVRSVDDVGSFDGYDAVVLGSAIYMMRWMPAARAFAEAREDELCARPLWLFSSGAAGRDGQVRPESSDDGRRLMHVLGAEEHRMFAGRIDPSQLSLSERAIIAAVRAPAGDHRDWDAISRYAETIARPLLANAPV